MQITEVRISLRNEEKLKAFASIVLDNELAINNLKVLVIDTGLLLAMPNRKDLKGVWHDITHPITQDFRKRLEKAVFDKYSEEVSKLSATIPAKAEEQKQ